MLKIIARIFPIAVVCIAAFDAAAQTTRGNRHGAPAIGGRASAGGAAVTAPTMVPGGTVQGGMVRAAGDTGGMVRAADAPISANDTSGTPLAVSEDPALAQARERAATDRANCIANNVGMAGVFVWGGTAARNSPDYATRGVAGVGMLREDIVNPANNTCWVRVDLDSSERNVNLSGISGAYFAENDAVTCGSWANKKDIESKILQAKSTGRTLATIGGAVGGAALGVAAAETVMHFGGWYRGQKTLAPGSAELICSNLLRLEKREQKGKSVQGELKGADGQPITTSRLGTKQTASQFFAKCPASSSDEYCKRARADDANKPFFEAWDMFVKGDRKKCVTTSGETVVTEEDIDEEA